MFVDEPTLHSIFTYDRYSIKCFFELSSQLEATSSFIFVNNTADSAGMVGGSSFVSILEVNQVILLSMKHSTFKKFNQQYSLIPHEFVSASMILLTAVSPSTMSQLTLGKHFKYLQLQWDKCLELYHLQ